MREKDRLDIKAINELVAESNLRKAITIGAKGAQGAAGGLATGGLVVTILAFAGISAAFLLQIVAAAAGGVVFSLAAIGMGAYQQQKDQRRIDRLKDSFENHLKDLRESLVHSLVIYQQLEEAEKDNVSEVARLTAVLSHIADEDEKKKVQHKLEDLDRDITELKKKRAELIDRVKISLAVIQGSNNSDKLKQLFGKVDGEVGKAAIHNYANLKMSLSDKEVEQVSNALEHFDTAIDKPLVENYKTSNYETELSNLIKPVKDKTHSTVKKLTYGLTGIGGFLGGSGTVITIGALVVGGMAALTGIGLPIFLAAVGVGLLTMGAGLLYHRHIEKRSQKTLNRLNVATAQLTGMKTYLNNVNKETRQELENINAKSLKASNEVSIKLEVHESSFKEYEEQTNSHSAKVKSLITELKTFKPDLNTLQNISHLKKAIEENIVLLEALKRQVNKIAILSGSEERKNDLLQNINGALEHAKQDLEVVTPIHIKVDRKLHELQSATDIAYYEEKAEAKLKVTPHNDLPTKTHSVKPTLEEVDSEGEGVDESDSEGEGEKGSLKHPR